MNDKDKDGSQSPAPPARKKADRINRSLIHREFIPIIIEGKAASRCKVCSFPIQGKNPTNLKTHLRSCNPLKLKKVEGMLLIVYLDNTV